MNNEIITIKDIMKQWKLILVSTIIFALLAFIIAVTIPAKYQSDISVIVVQKQSSEKIDAFSATKSAEFLSNIFTRVIYTTSFFNDVQDAPFDVRRDFSQDPEEREKEWKKFISVKKINNTGIINISVFDESRKDAEETAKAVAYVLTTDSEKYHGGGERVTVRLIDGPNTPLRPTIPRILPTTAVGALFGFLLAIVFIYFFPNKHILSKKELNEEAVELDDDIAVENTVTNETTSNHFENTLQKNVANDQIEEENIEDEYVDTEVRELHERISKFSNGNG